MGKRRRPAWSIAWSMAAFASAAWAPAASAAISLHPGHTPSIGGGWYLQDDGPAAGEMHSLRYRLRPGDRFGYARTARVTGSLRLRAPGGGEAQPVSLQLDLIGLTTLEVRDALPDGSYRVLERHVLRAALNGREVPIPAIGPIERRLSPLGGRQDYSGDALTSLLPFGLGLPELLPGAILQFPPEPVRVGALWRTRAECRLPGQPVASIAVSSRFTAVEHRQGRKCALIASEAEIPALDILGGSDAGAGVLRVRGKAVGETWHALQTGTPVGSRIEIRLEVEARGAAGGQDPPAAGDGELVIVVEGHEVPPDTPLQPGRGWLRIE